MKNTIIRFASLVFICLINMFMISCGIKDSDIQASVESAKNSNPGAAAVHSVVSGGVVTFTGEFKDAKSKTALNSTVGKINGVKQVVDNSTITAMPAPALVEISVDDELVRSVADAIKDYSGVKSNVQDGIITLTGTIKRADLQRLMMSLNSLHPKKIVNQLTIK